MLVGLICQKRKLNCLNTSGRKLNREKIAKNRILFLQETYTSHDTVTNWWKNPKGSAYSSYFMRAIVARMRLPFFKKNSNFVHFCPNFQIFCLFSPFLPFLWKTLFSRIGPERWNVFSHGTINSCGVMIGYLGSKKNKVNSIKKW